MQKQKNKLLVICGPTATGKTDIGIVIARKFKGEIVAADSRQVYIGMDIGTGKDVATHVTSPMSHVKTKYTNKQWIIPQYQKEMIPIWMYDVVRPDEEFSVAQYRQCARTVINDIHNRSKLPIVVGGTGLYIQSLISTIDTIEIPQDSEFRLRANSLRLAMLQHILQEEDMQTWNAMTPSDQHNPRRLIRKIELARYYVDHVKQEGKQESAYDVCMIGLTTHLPALYQRIDERVNKRVCEGIESEIASLLATGYAWDLQSMSALGYRYISALYWYHYIYKSYLENHTITATGAIWRSDLSDNENFSIPNPSYQITNLIKDQSNDVDPRM